MGRENRPVPANPTGTQPTEKKCPIPYVEEPAVTLSCTIKKNEISLYKKCYDHRGQHKTPIPRYELLDF
jgi:hypothetical protein